jgi:Secretion system C-terminal sorting domain
MKFRSLLIILFTFFSQFLYSQSQEPVKLFLNNATAKIGDTVTLNLTVKNFKDIKYFRTYVRYFNTELSFIDYSQPAFNDLQVQYNHDNTGFQDFLFIDFTDKTKIHQLSDDAVLLKIRFKTIKSEDNSNSLLVELTGAYDTPYWVANALNTISTVCYSACININSKALSKLNFDTDIESTKCGGSEYIARIKNLGQTQNLTYYWSNGSTFDTARTYISSQVYSIINDSENNKSQISYNVGTSFFENEKSFSYSWISQIESCKNIKLTVLAEGGTPPYIYGLDSLPRTNNPVFNIINNNYPSLYISDSKYCSIDLGLNFKDSALNFTHTFIRNTCSSNVGKLEILPFGGKPKYKIYLDGILQNTSSITNVGEGLHIIRVVDSLNCDIAEQINLKFEPLDFKPYSSAFNGNCTSSSINVSIVGNTQNTYNFQLDNGSFQVSNIFTNVSIGKHVVAARNIEGCIVQSDFFEVKSTTNMYYTKEIVKTDCINRLFDIKIKPYNGVAPYKIKYTTEGGTLINPIDSVYKNVPETFSGHNIEITDAQGCVLKTRDTLYTRTLVGTDVTWNYEASSCTNKGKLTLISSINFQFKLDNGAFSNNRIYENVDAGIHLLYVQAEGFCNAPITLDLKAASAITYQKNVQLGCGSFQNTLNIIPNGGIAPYKVYLNDILSFNNGSFQNVVQGIYTVKIVDANGCSFTKKDTLNSVPAFEVKGDSLCRISGTMFLTPKVIFTESRPLLYQWSNGTNNSTLRLDNPQPMVYTVTVYDNGPNGTCSKVASFYILPQCVWPGDTDTSGVVNARDLFNIGLAYGETGFKRDSMDTRWYPHISKEWVKYTPNFINYKHIDTNGDGIINDSDTSAIAQNWALTHQLKPSSTPLSDRGAMPFLYVKNETIVDGSNALQIILGEGNLIAQNVYGVACTIDFDENLIDENSIYTSIKGSWLIEDNILSIYKVNAGKIHLVIVRKNKLATNGAGNIARLHFKTKKNVLLKNILFSIENQQVINEKGQEVPIVTKNTIINSSTPTIEIDTDSAIKLYPNPVTAKINIESFDSPFKEITLINTLGTVLKTYQPATKLFEIQLNDLPSGTYFLHIKTEKNTWVKYFIKA